MTKKVSVKLWSALSPALPLGVGHIRTKTHDYKRHGTLTLFAALNYLEGEIIARAEQKHTHVEWLRFLKQIERETPAQLQIHLIADNYSAHKHPKVRESGLNAIPPLLCILLQPAVPGLIWSNASLLNSLSLAIKAV